jgi:hypothetical protein
MVAAERADAPPRIYRDGGWEGWWGLAGLAVHTSRRQV